ncbi:MAG: nitroreductase/quinone reductase family protein [Nitrospira sp.]|nr:nitroreductase/quinone reductase family protein [Nitrospira sp.]
MKSNSEFKKVLDIAHELEITVTGRKSGRVISLPVWFVHGRDTLYLLPVKGSDTNWYKNVLKTPTMNISAEGAQITAEVKPITDRTQVNQIVEKFRAKYGAGEVKKYYSKFDACVEISL